MGELVLDAVVVLSVAVALVLDRPLATLPTPDRQRRPDMRLGGRVARYVRPRGSG